MSPKNASSRRRGLSILEMMISLMILAAAIAGFVQLLSLSAAQRRASEERRLAVDECANQAERLALLAWDELTADKLAGLALSDHTAAGIPSAKLAATLTDEPGPPAAKRVRIEVTWTGSSGQAGEPVGLTVWKHRPVEAQP